jgi:hypothetical protein
MKKGSFLLAPSLLALLMFFSSCKKEVISEQGHELLTKLIDWCKNGKTTVSVYATGLNNPRGLQFGPDGNLYVAEGGTGGTRSTAGLCEQVVPPVGPYLGSPTSGRISKIGKDGVRTTITDKLPSTKGNELAGGDISGVSDVEFVGNTLYALITGGGCSHGNPDFPNSIIRVNTDGSYKIIADLSSWAHLNPVSKPNAGDFEPDGDWYSMVNAGDNLYAMEANRGELVKVGTNGKISRVMDISASQGHIVPTSLAYNGDVYFGNLAPFPIKNGSSNIYKLDNTNNTASVIASGLTTVLGLVADKMGRFYVLQNTTDNPFPTPSTGSIVVIDRKGKKETIATGFNLPTGLTMGRDGNLYVSNVGFGPGALGGGQVLKVDISQLVFND